MQKTRVRRAGALVVGLTLVAAACGGSDDTATPVTDPATAETDMTETSTASTDMTETTTAATDMTEDTTAATDMTEETTADTTADSTAAPSGDVAGAMAGFKGTTPLVELAQDFKDRLATVPTGANLTDYNYAGETYDIFVILALATEIAGTDGIDMAKEIQGVTRDGEKCTTYVDCLALVQAGTDIDYDGLSGEISLNGVGDPLSASYGVLTFGDDNRIDDSLTEYIPANAPDVADVAPIEIVGAREGDGILKVGGLLPETGSLAFLGPPEIAAAELAVKEINEAGGVLGVPMEYLPGDSGDTSTDLASQTVDKHLAANVDAIVGAASSSVSLTVVDKITAAGVVEFSPANTSDKFTTYDDKGLYFRVAPPDVLQGALVAELVAGDGNGSAYILALDDAYGTGLADVVESILTESGVTILGKKIYDPKAAGFDAEVDEIKAADPDAIVLITFDEGSRILRTMVEKGIGPKDKLVYGVDGNTGNALGENFDAGA
ncbi:MAG: ABC transporter substrate-binding protein [Ilumatobacteraceae bacterium]